MGVFTLSTVLALSVWILIVLVVLFVILNFYLVRRMAKSQTAFRPLPTQIMSHEGLVNETDEFQYGSELQGRGYMTRTDTLVGLSIWILATAAVMVGFLNLYVIKKLSIFHNSFGVLWVSRTIGEIGANLPNIFYAGPVTIFQPKDIDPTAGIVAWTVAFFFAFESCIMVQSVSANRMIAVCWPLKYEHIFSQRLTKTLILITWFSAAFIIALYYTYDTLILTHLNNGLALILFNPEVHEFLGINFWRLKKKRSDMSQQGLSNLTEHFRYGSELQGRGYMTRLDTLVGLSIWLLASAAVMVGFLNLYLIKKLSIFHNSFGVLWVSRTIGEIGANLPNIFYAGPVTIFQPKDIHPAVGIVAWTVAFFFSFESCIMVQSVSANRMIAVCAPLNYDFIFTKRLTAVLIIATWIAAALIISMYYIFQVLANNSKESGRHEYFVLAYDTLILTQLNNGLALVLFNPEVHELLGLNFWCLKRKRRVVTSPFVNNTERPSSTAIFMGVFTLSTVLALSVWILIVLVVLFVILNFYLVRRMAKSQTAFRPLPMTTKIGVEPNGNYIHRIQTMPQEGNPTEEFVYGSELQGHGHMSRLDTLVGLSIWMVSLQPRDIDPITGIVAWTVAFFFSFESCIMVQSVSANRMIAVCSPLNYDYIFTKRLTATLITVTWLALILFNPEVHEFLGINFWCLKKRKPAVLPCSTTALSSTLTIAARIDD
ncbi:hypothetical protein QR680_015096 [Steinernema hermaphroditum]|uniref:7TM GPCR serpentine receptor class x (Srx) domain-containing protein n=1 Tax=Steinernema hermaphroditum TaxID=289476 RepID=A0AA39M5D5_9BILA|nr:hypothetical protein QR680_015096 [Steinernema hermaphroditum]